MEQKLAAGGVKRLIPNRGYRRFLPVRAGQFEIDARRVREEARYDGKYVLRTTTDLPAEEIALAYKNLLWIERLFRELKSLLETRPIYHHWVKDNVKGHIFGCFLALYLVVVLRKKIETASATCCAPISRASRTSAFRRSGFDRHPSPNSSTPARTKSERSGKTLRAGRKPPSDRTSQQITVEDGFESRSVGRVFPPVRSSLLLGARAAGYAHEGASHRAGPI